MFPLNPPPTDIKFTAYQPNPKDYAIDGISSQTRITGRFKFQVEFMYSGLDFDQRDELQGAAIEMDGRAGETDLIVPTYSENKNVVSSTGTADAAYPVGTSVITLNFTGELKPMNLIRGNGKKRTYCVTSAQTPSGGKQTVTIRPRLQEAVALNDVFLIKDVPINVSIDSDSIAANSKDMSGSLSFKFIEEPA